MTEPASLTSKPATDPTHDHAWRRVRYDIHTDQVDYACETCPVTWTGPRISPWDKADGKHLRRG